MVRDGRKLDPLQQDEMVRTIAKELVAAAPEDWVEIRQVSLGTVQISQESFEWRPADGEFIRIETPGQVINMFTELRDGMRQKGQGTWFTAVLMIDRSGKYSIEYDYDNEPAFVPQLTDGAYALDYDYFRRDDEHTPDWLRRKLEGNRTDPKGVS
ncbi:immunity protein YezG family protein [Nocardia carnea]|uniref:Immunity protein YezG family protein n=1 Tax=Nocardia carnea TaxID=37328 RepID=A0ABW7TEF6_9NOCA|nr:immunity protein YezG family protein [Nocardia carnea]